MGILSKTELDPFDLPPHATPPLYEIADYSYGDGVRVPTKEKGHLDPTWGQRLDTALYLRNIRKLYAFAVEIGVDESALSRWRNGKPVSLSNAIAICDALNISMDWLIRGKGSMELTLKPIDPAGDEASSQNRIKALESALKSLLLTSDN